jgi:hypothetical protein
MNDGLTAIIVCTYMCCTSHSTHPPAVGRLSLLAACIVAELVPYCAEPRTASTWLDVVAGTPYVTSKYMIIIDPACRVCWYGTTMYYPYFVQVPQLSSTTNRTAHLLPVMQYRHVPPCNRQEKKNKECSSEYELLL